MTDPERPYLACEHGRLPLRAIDVRAEVVGATAAVAIEQTFENPYDEVLAVRYVFPLPELAAVTRCELVVAGRVIAAQLRERGEAREVYADAVARGRRAALAEEDRHDVFTLTLGNLGPRERATVRFGLAYPLPREDGRLALRFPLVVGERYVPAAADADAVAEAARVSPPRLAPGADRPDVAIAVVLVHGELPVRDLEASHAIAAAPRAGDAGATLVRVAGPIALDRDFVLRFRVGDDAVRTQLAVTPDGSDAGGGGTFQLTLVPPASPVRPIPRDVVLVLDRSGSMAGWKIVAARRALARMIDELDTGDRFAAYAFGSVTLACADLAHDRLHAATARARACASEFLAGLTADGGTEMRQPLELACELLGGDDSRRERWLVLVTDGRVSNEDELVAIVARARGVKLLALGIDDAVNAALLGRLARATGGRVELVPDHGALEDALDRLHLLLASPAIERVAVAGEGGLEVVADTVVPPAPRHAYPGAPLVVRGRYRGSAAGALRVTGTRAREPFSIAVAAARSDSSALRACWAREQLLALEDRLVVSPGNAALHDQLVATSLDSGVLCRFTAFVAADDAPAAAPATRELVQPVEPTFAAVAAPAIAPRATMAVSRFGGDGAAARSTRTASGTLRGKLAYLAPEQARGQPLDARVEVFVLAQLLWELVTGRRLWSERDDFSTLQAISSGTLPEPFLPPELAALAQVLRRALAVDRAHRYATPAALADALDALPVAPASPDAIAGYLRDAHAAALAAHAALATRIARAAVPAGGYTAIARLTTTSTGELLVAATAANEPVVLRRAHPWLVEDPDALESFLSAAAVALPGFVHTSDAGTDTLGGVFLAQTYVPGCTLRELRRVPVAVALGVISQAARAADRALSLRDPSGDEVGILLRDLDTHSLRVGIDGRTAFTSLGRAPSPHFTAPRRTGVPLRMLATASTATSSHIPPAAGRAVVVPRRARPFWKPR